MKQHLLIVKCLLLGVVASAAFVGYGFFEVWRVNEVPVVQSIRWQDTDSVDLGREVALELEVQAPWHRSLAGARPRQLPDALIASATGEHTLTRGPLDWRGTRAWSLTIPVVATAARLEEDAAITLPLIPIRRTAVNTISVELPALTVRLPGELPEEPHNPMELLAASAPPPVMAEAEAPPPPSRVPWLMVIAGGLLVALFVVVLRALRKPKPAIPAWELAHAHLDRLKQESNLSPERYFSRLTDILKQYAAARFDAHATAASSTEFIAALKDLPSLPETQQTMLGNVMRKADAVKFAGAEAGSDAANQALDAVRNFVNETTPEPGHA